MDRSSVLSRILYTVLQCTWGILQNIIGLVIFLILIIMDPHRGVSIHHGAVVVRWNSESSMAMGMFIFFGHFKYQKSVSDSYLVHEYGHTIQSAILGPLYLPVIGIPSIIWASLPVFTKLRESGYYSYFDFYPEKWANREGEKSLKQPAPKPFRKRPYTK